MGSASMSINMDSVGCDLEPIQVPHVLAEPICLGSASMSINTKSDGIEDTAGSVTWNQSRYSTYWRSP